MCLKNFKVNLLLFFSSHTTRTTTWEDPRKSLAAQAAIHQSAEHLLSNQVHQTPNSTRKILKIITIIDKKNKILMKYNKAFIF